MSFNIGDIVADRNGTLSKVKEVSPLYLGYAQYIICEKFEDPIYYECGDMNRRLFRLATPEEIAEVIARKMLK
jgi:hypothetical protein